MDMNWIYLWWTGWTPWHGNAADWAEEFYTVGDEVCIAMETAGNHSRAWSWNLHIDLLDISNVVVELSQEHCTGFAASRSHLTTDHSEACVQLKVTKYDPQIMELSKEKQGQGSLWLVSICLCVAHMALHNGALCPSLFFHLRCGCVS